jgi:hypothetical protein
MCGCANFRCADDQVLRSLLVEREHPEQARTTPNTPEHAKKLIDSAASLFKEKTSNERLSYRLLR